MNSCLFVGNWVGIADVVLGFEVFGDLVERGTGQYLLMTKACAGRVTAQNMISLESASRFGVVLGWEEEVEVDLDNFLGRFWVNHKAHGAVSHSPVKGVCPVRRATNDYILESPVEK